MALIRAKSGEFEEAKKKLENAKLLSLELNDIDRRYVDILCHEVSLYLEEEK